MGPAGASVPARRGHVRGGRAGRCRRLFAGRPAVRQRRPGRAADRPRCRTAAKKCSATKHGQYVHAVAYSPDGKQLATGSSDHKIRIVDAETGDARADARRPHRRRAQRRVLARWQAAPQRLVRQHGPLWDLATGTPLQTLKGHSWWVWAAEFSPDAQPHRHRRPGRQGDRVAESRTQGAGSRESNFPVPSPESPAPLYQAHRVHRPRRRRLRGRVLAGRQARRHRRLRQARDDLESGRSAAGRHRASGSTASPKPKPNYLRLAGPRRAGALGRLLAQRRAGRQRQRRQRDPRLGRRQPAKSSKALRGHGSAVRACAFSPDGKFVLSGGQDEQPVRLWNLAGYQEVRVLHATVFAGHDDAVLSARFSPDGQQDRHRQPRSHGQPVGCRHRRAAAAIRRRARVPGHQRRVLPRWPAAWRPARATTRFASGTSRRHATGRARADRPARHARRLAGRRLDRHRQPRHRRPSLGQPTPARRSATARRPRGRSLRRRLFARRRPARQRRRPRPHAALAKDGERPDSWTLDRELRGHSRSITALRFTPDGQRLVTASGDRTCGQWDVATGAKSCATGAQASRMGDRRSTSRPTARWRSPRATTARRGSGGWPTRNCCRR